MADVAHQNLTGSELHEPKGVDSAASGTVYRADGSGSGSWTDIVSTINNANKVILHGEIADLSTASTDATALAIPIPINGSITDVRVKVDSNFTGSANVITIEKLVTGQALGSGTNMTPTLSVPAASGANLLTSVTQTTNNSVTTSNYIIVKTNGAGTGATRASFTITLDVE